MYDMRVLDQRGADALVAVRCATAPAVGFVAAADVDARVGVVAGVVVGALAAAECDAAAAADVAADAAADAASGAGLAAATAVGALPCRQPL